MSESDLSDSCYADESTKKERLTRRRESGADSRSEGEFGAVVRAAAVSFVARSLQSKEIPFHAPTYEGPKLSELFGSCLRGCGASSWTGISRPTHEGRSSRTGPKLTIRIMPTIPALQEFMDAKTVKGASS